VSINPQRFGDGIWVSRPSLLAARSFGEFSFALQMSYRLRHTFPAEAIKRPKQYAVKLSPGSSVQERGELLSPVSAPSATSDLALSRVTLVSGNSSPLIVAVKMLYLRTPNQKAPNYSLCDKPSHRCVRAQNPRSVRLAHFGLPTELYLYH
jgi:hypothetical protein